jgi:hypothetical protein
MTTVINSKELAQFRAAFQNYTGQDAEDVLEAIDIIEECEGKLEDAMEILMIKSGQEPLRGADDWINWENITQGLRKFICHPDFENLFVEGLFSAILDLLFERFAGYPKTLLIPIILYVFKKGREHFCQ